MRVTYINHSCFLVELKQSLLLFDYYSRGLTGDGSVPGLPPLPDKKLYVFVSHKHQDHFDLKVFGLEQLRRDTEYILSKDTRMNEKYMRRRGVPESAWSRIHYIGKNECCEAFPGLVITTFASTDEGVAFLVRTEGRVLYHAGDLNWWTWNGETEAEYADMERRFKQEIKKLEGIPIDAAFLPLDPRQEERFYWGFDYFMRHTDTKLAWPMHFWGDRSVIERLRQMKVSEGYRERIADTESEAG